ncbi:MAG: recombinase family protein [Lachnospiraceae bacterium]|nr:recombinase family protein [Lachnospiraceae bacterium]
MNVGEEKLNSTEEKKARIRERYKGVSEDQLAVIPAVPKLDIFDKDRNLRVAVYARVSTDDPNQTSSYELQKNHYTDLISRNPNWTLVDIYADEGISGTSLQHRDNFVRMIKDCEAGLIDLIVTKSVSRFARNLIDSVGYIRKLGAMKPPIGVFFETENLNTLNSQSEMTIAFLSTMAQEESHTKSDIMNASIEMRFKRGIFLTPPLLGYDQDADGNLVVNEEEAKTVRLIFFMYLYGYTCQQIADTLSKLKRKTKKGNTTWSGSSVLQQLQNERHCGSVLARKTFTPSYLDHKSKRNRQDRNQYFQEDHHEPIIARTDFIAVQHIIQNSRCGNSNILPVLQVIPDGALAGYVSINPRWAGFKPKDYIAASETVAKGNALEISDSVIVEEGDPDLRGFEIVRSQFIDVANKFTISFSPNKLKFSTAAIKKLDCNYVEILVHPKNKSLVIRKTNADSRLAFQWSRSKDGYIVPREMGVSAIMPCIYSLFNWNISYKYRIQGTVIEDKDIKLLVFNVNDAETFLPLGSSDGGTDENDGAYTVPNNVSHFGTKNSTIGYPASWANDFGDEYYSQQKSIEVTLQHSHLPLIIPAEPSIYNPNPDISIPSQDHIAGEIEIIMKDMTNEDVVNE